uniref:Uncharacterized protein n=1 Tax=Brassica oleracea TaxID=3712 RepID=A0A3P6G2J9_BRAOL|nr:unnamed protein product [Brassica oleracea]
MSKNTIHPASIDTIHPASIDAVHSDTIHHNTIHYMTDFDLNREWYDWVGQHPFQTMISNQLGEH